jgi:hypothetical protein
MKKCCTPPSIQVSYCEKEFEYQNKVKWMSLKKDKDGEIIIIEIQSILGLPNNHVMT